MALTSVFQSTQNSLRNDYVRSEKSKNITFSLGHKKKGNRVQAINRQKPVGTVSGSKEMRLLCL